MKCPHLLDSMPYCLTNGVHFARSSFIFLSKALDQLSLRFHDHLQPMHKLAGFQFFQINNGDPKLGGAMTGGGIAGFGRDDDRFGALAAETVPQDGKFVEGLGLDVAGLAAEEQWDDPAGGHDVDLVQDAAVPQHVIPPNHGAADHIMEDRGIHAGLVGIQLEHAAHIAQPCPGMHIPETERYLLVGNDR